MFEIRTILHPTDFSESSDAARQLARSLARDQGARLVVLHVASIEYMADGMMSVSMDLEAFQRALDQMKSTLDGQDLKFPVEVRLKVGIAASEILRTAEAERCDLIVMGSHGRTGLSRLLMGSVAEEVMRGARCPVLILKPPPPEPSETGSAPKSVTVI